MTERDKYPEIKSVVNILEKEEVKCVLLLGPEAPFFGKGTRYSNMLKFLEESGYKSSVRIYEEEDLITTKGLKDYQCSLFYSALNKYYENLGPNQMHREIAEIPFQAIISLTPDEFMQSVFIEQNYPFTTDYFSHKKPSALELPIPTRNTPLIYNLMGKLKDEESLALDHDSFFSFLLEVTKRNQLPETVRKVIEDAQLFVFIGFRLEKWYFKLLIRILNIHQSSSFSPNGDLVSNVVAVYEDHFKFTFSELEPETFIRFIYEECESNNKKFLRKYFVERKPDYIEFIEQVRLQLKQGELSNGLDLLDGFIKKNPPISHLGESLLAIHSRWNSTKNDYDRGKIKIDDYSSIREKTMDFILDLIKQIQIKLK